MKRRLTRRKLLAIVDALNFVMAGEWDEDSHEPDGDYTGALEWAVERLYNRGEQQ